MGYDAFISYSHDSDARLGPALQAALERLTKPWWKRRALHVFCDTTALSASPGLWPLIADAMEQSDYLVVLASPAATQSEWCGREIEHWRSTKPEGTILPVLTDGELVWDDATGDFDPVASTALHPALRGAFAQEPLYADLRFARTDDDLTLRNPALLAAAAELAAPIHGIPKDEIVGEDLRQHRRTRRTAWGAVAAVGLLAVATMIGAVVALDKASEAQEQADKVLEANLSLDQAESRLTTVRGRADAAGKRAERAGQNAKRSEARANSAESQAQFQSLIAAQREADARDAELSAANQRRLAALARDAADNATARRLVAEGELGKTVGQLAATNGALTTANGELLVVGGQLTTANSKLVQAGEDLTAAGEQLTIVEKAAKAAATDARNSRADSLASRLAAESLQPDLAEQAPDLALALANAATQVEPEAEPPAALRAMAPPSRNRPAAAARGALLTLTQRARDGLLNHLHTKQDEVPAALGTIAVSALRDRVAAAEISFDIASGEATDRLYVWLDGLAPQDRAIELSSRLENDQLGCITELQWDATGRYLISVEELLGIDGDGEHVGCINAYEDPRLTNPLLPPDASAYAFRTVRVWDVESTEPPLTYNAFSLAAKSPIAVTEDGTQAFLQAWDPVPGGTTIQGLVRFELGVVAADGFPQRQFVEDGYLSSTILGSENFSPDGRTALVIAGDITVPAGGGLFPMLWNLPTDEIHELADLFTGLHLSVNPEGTFAAVLGSDETSVQFFDAASGAEVAQSYRVASGFVCSVGLGPDGLAVVSSAADEACQSPETVVSAIRWTNAPPARGIWTKTIVRGGLGPVAFSPLGQLVITDWFSPHAVGIGSTNHTLILDGATGSERADFLGRVAQLSPDEKLVVAQELDPILDPATDVGSITQRVSLWDLAQLPAARVLQSNVANAVPARDGRSVAVVPGGVPERLGATFSLFQGVSVDSPTAIWRLDQGPGVQPRNLPGPNGGIRAATFRPDGLLVGVGEATIGFVWDPARRPYDVVNLEPSSDELSVAVSPVDGSTLAVSTTGRSLLLRRVDVEQGTKADAPLPLSLVGAERIDWMHFSRDGQLLLVNLADTSAVTPINPRGMTRALVIRVTGPNAGTTAPFPEAEAVTSSQDGTRIAFLSLESSLSPRRSRLVVRETSDLSAIAWSIDTSALGEDRYLEAENTYALDETGTRAAGTNADGRLVVWQQGQTPLVFTPGSGVAAGVQLFGVAFAPDGKEPRTGKIALATSDKQIRLYDPKHPATEPLTRQVLNRAASRLRFSNDGQLLLIDGIYLLDAESLVRIGPRLHPESWNDLGISGSGRSDLGTSSTFFTADNRYVVAVRVDSSEVVRWPVGLGVMRTEACRASGRNLTPKEAGHAGLASGDVCPNLPQGGG